MDYSSVFAVGDNNVNQEKPPPRVCPRCNSNNTKFCYYNNYTVSQPRYKCNECHRHWTHGGALRNIPIGGNSRKISAKIQQVSRRHQPFLHGQESNQFVGSFGGSSSYGITIGNQVGSFPETNHGDIVLPFHSFPPIDRSYFHDELFREDHYNVKSNDLIGNYLNNQSIGSYNVPSCDHNSYINQREDQNKWNHQSFNNTMIMNHNASTSGSRESWDTYYNVPSCDHNSYINQREDQNKWNHLSFNNTMNMNHNASTSGSRESWDTYHMNKNNCVSKSSYQNRGNVYGCPK